MFGFAAIAAIAAMAFIGASSASALSTLLCKANETECKTAANQITHVHFTDPSAILLATLLGVHVEILCAALFLGTVLGLGTPQIIHGNFSFGATGSCTDLLSKEKCGEIKETSASGLLKILRLATEPGEVTGEGFQVLVECVGLHCVYSAEGLKGEAFGKSTGHGEGEVRVLNQSVTKVSGFLCPSSAALTAHYQSLPNEPIFLKE